MNPTQPALSLLIGMCLILSIGVPVLAWLLLVGRHNRPASLWFTGMLCSAMGIVAIAVFHSSTGITAALMSVALALLTIAIRMDVPGYRPHWRIHAVWLMGYTLLQAWLDLVDLRMIWGITLTSCVLIIQEGIAAFWTYRTLRLYKSRGLLLIALGLIIVLASNVFRLVSVWMQGESTTIFSFTLASNLTILSVTMTTVLFSFGYVLFMLEKSHLQHMRDMQASARAEERSRIAQEHAEKLQQIVEQRDAMILLSSRFSATSSMLTFNSAIVHEISQPLQVMRLLFEMISLIPDDDAAGLRLKISQAQDVVTGMTESLQSLRDQVLMQKPQLEVVQVSSALAEIEPILRTQANHSGIELHCMTEPATNKTTVLAQKVLLQRIVFNLIANALEAMKMQDMQEHSTKTDRSIPAIKLSACLHEHKGAEYIVVQVQDNGPGLPEQILQSSDHVFFTTKPQGMGIGLLLARVISQSWRGDLRFYNNPSLEGGGACVQLWIPMHSCVSE